MLRALRLSRIPASRGLRALTPLAQQRAASSIQSSGSLMREIMEGEDKDKDKKGAVTEPEVPMMGAKYHTNKELREHPYVKRLVNPEGQAAMDSLLSPLKRALYMKVVEKNGGRYVNKQMVEHENRTYKLNLTKEEQAALVPTVYCHSYRIKGSWKKAYMFLRMFRRMPLNEAITQCHFSAKRMAHDVGEMLERGRSDAIKLGIAPESLLVSQIWVGKEPEIRRRLDFKGRGRTGIIEHPYVHVKAILQDKSVEQQKKADFKKRLDKKVWFPLRNWKIKEDFVQTADYKW